MKLSKLMLTSLAFTTALNAQEAPKTAAAATSQTNQVNFYEKLQDSPLKLNLVNAIGRDFVDSAKTDNTLYTTLSYKIDSKNKVSLYNKFSSEFQDHNAQKNTHESKRVSLKYKRSKVLEEKENFVDLALGGEFRVYTNDADRDEHGMYSLFKVTADASKTLGDIGATFHLAYGQTQLKDKNALGKIKNYVNVVLGQSYSISDSLTFGLVQDMIQINSTQDGSINSKGKKVYSPFSMDFSAGLTYTVNEFVSVGTSVATTIFSSNDQRFLASATDLKNAASYELAISINAF